MTVPRWALFVVDLWLQCKLRAPVMLGGGRGPTPYPVAGGWLDQPAALIDGFALLDSWLREKEE